MENKGAYIISKRTYHIYELTPDEIIDLIVYSSFDIKFRHSLYCNMRKHFVILLKAI